jgi:hypothetical protein
MDAGARLPALRRAELAALAALAAAALVAWLAYPVLPTYDSLSALVWGRDILHGHLPEFDAYGAPTEHPLWLAVGTLLALLGGAGARAMTLLTIASEVALAAGAYRLGRSTFGALAGALAAGLLLTRLDFGFYAAFAFLDVTFAALVVWAAVLEAERERRGGAVWALLVLAGLLRPEGWVYAAAYGAWLWRSGARRLRIAAWVAAAPLLWMLTDLVVTGRPLFSWTYTTDEAAALGRQRGVAQLPDSVFSALEELLKPPLLALAVLGLGLALYDRRGPRLRMPLALVGLGLLTFAGLVLGGVSAQVPRYASVAAVGLLIFAGQLLARLLRPPSGVPARVAWAATIVLALVAAGWTVTRIHPRSVTSLLRFRHAVEQDLAATLRSPAVTRARGCGPVALATHKLVPAARWADGSPPGAIFARADRRTARRAAPGVVLVELGARLLVDPGYGPFAKNSADTGLVSQEPPDGFRLQGRSHYFAVYVRC